MSETRNQKRIREILDEAPAEEDHSLQAQALKRADPEHVPRTMTPWEWEQWYAEHGVPPEHQQRPEPTARPGLWQRLLQRLGVK